MAKWKIPSCYKCNTEYGALEEDLWRRLACCVDPNAAAASGIYPKVLRSMDARHASNPNESHSRIVKRNKLLAEMRHGDEIPQDGIYPGLGERWNRQRVDQIAITIPANSFRRLTEKIVRGVYFIEDKRFIESPYAINFYAVEDEGAAEIKGLLNRFATEFARGPGILINRAVTPEDGVSAIISIEVWGAVKMYATLMSN